MAQLPLRVRVPSEAWAVGPKPQRHMGGNIVPGFYLVALSIVLIARKHATRRHKPPTRLLQHPFPNHRTQAKNGFKTNHPQKRRDRAQKRHKKRLHFVETMTYHRAVICPRSQGYRNTTLSPVPKASTDGREDVVTEKREPGPCV